MQDGKVRELPGVRKRALGLLRVALVVGALAAGSTLAPNAAATGMVYPSEAGPLRVTEVARGLESPWALAFLPDGRLLVTERPGRMRIVDAQGRVSEPVTGVPEVHARGHGGLLDVVLGPDFARDRLIVFSYAEPTARGARTAVARARLDADGLRLDDVRRIFAQDEDP